MDALNRCGGVEGQPCRPTPRNAGLSHQQIGAARQEEANHPPCGRTAPDQCAPDHVTRRMQCGVCDNFRAVDQRRMLRPTMRGSRQNVGKTLRTQKIRPAWPAQNRRLDFTRCRNHASSSLTSCPRRATARNQTMAQVNDTNNTGELETTKVFLFTADAMGMAPRTNCFALRAFQEPLRPSTRAIKDVTKSLVNLKWIDKKPLSRRHRPA